LAGVQASLQQYPRGTEPLQVDEVFRQGKELDRTQNRSRHRRDKVGHFRVVEKQPHIEQAMKSQRPALRIGRFKRKTICHLGWRETYAMARFQHRPVMAADHFVLGLESVDLGVLQRLKQAP